MRPMNERIPDTSYVRDEYNAMLRNMPTTYAFHRWGENAVARVHYRQTRRALSWIFGKKKFDRVLEVGGGDGVWTELVAARANGVEFIDISDEMITRAKERLSPFPNISFTRADFLAYAPSPRTFDLALSVRNLEYMPDKKAAIGKYAAALRDGGTLAIVTKNPGFRHVGSVSKKLLHTSQIPVGELLALMQESGFHNVRIYPAIIGIGLKYGLLRLFWTSVQIKCLVFRPLVPVRFLELFSESILVVGTRA